MYWLFFIKFEVVLLPTLSIYPLLWDFHYMNFGTFAIFSQVTEMLFMFCQIIIHFFSRLDNFYWFVFTLSNSSALLSLLLSPCTEFFISVIALSSSTISIWVLSLVENLFLLINCCHILLYYLSMISFCSLNISIIAAMKYLSAKPKI